MPVVPGSFLWPPNNTPIRVPYLSGSRRSDSAALLNDGRVLYVCTVGSEVRQGYASSVRSFIRNNSVTNVTTIFSGPDPSCCVFRHPTSGTIFLVLARGPIPRDNTEDWPVQVWRSPSGAGGDWVLHGTVDVATFTASNGRLLSGIQMVGEPHILPSGRWVLPATRYVGMGNNEWWVQRQPVFTSDDGGVTFTMRADLGYYILGGAYGESGARNITPWAGNLYHSTSGNVDAEKSEYSSDGTSWTEYHWPREYEGVNYCLADNDWLYFTRLGMVAGESSFLKVYRTKTPTNTTASGYELHRTYNMVPGIYNEGQSAIVQKLGNTVVLMFNGMILGKPRCEFTVGQRVICFPIQQGHDWAVLCS